MRTLFDPIRYRWVAAPLLAMFVAACDSGGSDDVGQTSLSLTSALTHDAVAGADGITVIVGADELAITRARLVLRRIKFKPVEDDVGMEFSAAARVVDLPLDSSVLEISVADVPPDAYDVVEFRVHRVDPKDPEDAAAIDEAPGEFSDFIADERYSLIVEGTYGGEAFTFRSREDDDQEVVLSPPLVVADGASSNVTLVLAPADWFVDNGGTMLDPRAEENEDLIEENFKQAIEGFRDDDQDGDEDESAE